MPGKPLSHLATQALVGYAAAEAFNMFRYFINHLLLEGLAEFKTAAAPKSLGAQIFGTLRIARRTLSVIASIPPGLGHRASSQGAANWV